MIDELLNKDWLFPEDIDKLAEILPNIKLEQNHIYKLWYHMTIVDGGSLDISEILRAIKNWYGETLFICEIQNSWPNLEFNSKVNIVYCLKYDNLLNDGELKIIFDLIIRYETKRERLLLLFIIIVSINRTWKSREFEQCKQIVLSIKKEVNSIKSFLFRRQENSLIDRINSSIKFFQDVSKQ